MKIVRPNASDVDRIRTVLYLSADNIIQSLKDELQTYLVKAADTPDDFDSLKDTLPWSKSIATDLSSCHLLLRN